MAFHVIQRFAGSKMKSASTLQLIVRGAASKSVMILFNFNKKFLLSWILFESILYNGIWKSKFDANILWIPKDTSKPLAYLLISRTRMWLYFWMDSVQKSKWKVELIILFECFVWELNWRVSHSKHSKRNKCTIHWTVTTHLPVLVIFCFNIWFLLSAFVCFCFFLIWWLMVYKAALLG